MSKERRLLSFNEVLTLTFFLLPFHLIFQGTYLHAQNQSKQQITALKNSKVIFVIPTGSAKLKALREEVSLTENKRKIKFLEQLIIREQLEVDSFTRALRAAVEGHFDFADRGFIPDTSLKALVQENREHPVNLFVVRRAVTESGADALILFDATLQPLGRPFPYYARIAKFTSFIDAFFGKSDYNWRDLPEAIRRWSDRLNAFYRQSG